MKKHVKRVVVLAIGWLLIAFGVIGLFLPVLQGVLFILLGLWVLSTESATAKRWLEQARQRHPKADAKLKQWGRWWRRKLGRERREDTTDPIDG
jgi:uncharacterized membrane protein YbaN (DUF454 family)